MDLFNYITDEKLKLINSDFDKKYLNQKKRLHGISREIDF